MSPAVVARPKILLHTCCAVCFEAVYPALEELGYEPTAFFFNPNIHPYREFEKRLRATEVAAEERKVELLAERSYGLQLYLDEILPAGDRRCRACYALRLDATAREAAGRDFDCFTTTLLASPHQKHDQVREAGEAGAAGGGIDFLYRDWRDRMDEGIRRARKRSLYRQRYCGCIWSEYERFAPTAARPGTENGVFRSE